MWLLSLQTDLKVPMNITAYASSPFASLRAFCALNPHFFHTPPLLSPPLPYASPSSSELLFRRWSSSLLGALSATSGMLTRNLRSSLRTVMVSLPLLFSTRCLVSSRDRFSVVIPLIWSMETNQLRQITYRHP